MCSELAKIKPERQVLHTARLRLVPVTHSMKVAFNGSRDAFAKFVGVALPSHWPAFPQAFKPALPGSGTQASDSWPGFLFILRDHPLLIGNGGFACPPDAEGRAEIGYEIAPSQRNRGFATEAAHALVNLAFAQGASATLAHTLDEDNASNAVLAKVGMRLETWLPHVELGTVRRYRMDRPTSFTGQVETPPTPKEKSDPLHSPVSRMHGASGHV